MKRDVIKNQFFRFFNSFSSLPFYLFLIVFISRATFALDMDDPSLGGLEEVLIRVMNWLVFLIGVVFVVVVAYGAWKAATATGDPRGLDSAKGTWTYAIFGVIVVAGFLAIFTIVSGWFGFDIGIGSIFTNINDAIDNLINVTVNQTGPQTGP